MDGGHTALMSAGAGPDVKNGVLIPDFRMYDPLGRLAQSELERLGAVMAGVILIHLVLHAVLLREITLDPQLVPGFDGHQPLVVRHFPDQRFDQRGFAGIG
ncbi:hypothetical protein D3C76_1128710 [compost metagenome]